MRSTLRYPVLVNPVGRWAAVEVPRCGLTTLRAVHIRDCRPDLLGSLADPDPHAIHRAYFASPATRIVFADDPLFARDNPARPRVFRVVRDPRERILSLWRGFRHSRHRHAPLPDDIQGRSLGDFLNFIETHAPIADLHFVPQRVFASLEVVDDIVHLRDLSTYLRERCGCPAPPRLNSSLEGPAPRAPAADVERIARLFPAPQPPHVPEYKLWRRHGS